MDPHPDDPAIWFCPARWREARAYCLPRLRTREARGGVFGKVILSLIDMINGAWTGYPKCCILQYVWREWSSVRPLAIQGLLDSVNSEDDFGYWLAGTNYVQCRKCFAARYAVPRHKHRKGAIPTKWFTKESP